MKGNSKIPLVAIVTRTKDRPQMLERCIKSVMAQTFKDFLMIIVNDGGDPAEVEKLLKKHTKLIHGRVRVLHNKKPGGMQPASNQAIKNSESKYITMLDDDDTWHPRFLELTIEHLVTTGAMGVVVPTDRVFEEQRAGRLVKVAQDRMFPGLKYISLYNMCAQNYAMVISFVYCRKVFDEIGGYDPALDSVGDWDFALRFLLKYDIDFLDSEEALAYYHQRPSATAANANSIFTGSHRYHENKIANKYLRQDIKEGKTGIGHIINSLKRDYDEDQRFLQVQRQERAAELSEISRRLSELESLILSSNKRLYAAIRSLPSRAVRKAARGIWRFGG